MRARGRMTNKPQTLPVRRVFVEKMAAGRVIPELPSLCFCTVSEKCLNINSKSHGHIHCPCEVCLGEVVYPTTAWRHLQRAKKARLSNEQDEEWSSLPNSEPGTSTSATNFSDDVDCERASACGFYSETASSGFCDFAENVSDRDETDSVNSEGSSNSGNMTVDEEEENADPGSEEDFYDSNGPVEDDNDSNGEGEDDVDNFIFDAIIRAIEMKDQMAISIQHFEDLLCWGKDLYLKNNNAAENNVPTLWPSKWDEVCSLLENIGYSTPKLYWVCLDSSHPCLYSLLENKEDCCPHCGKHGSIPYYYLSITNKVKRWCSSSSMCKKMTAHWQQRDHWLPPDRKTGWGYGLKKEFWDGKRFAELAYFWNPDEEWVLPVRCPQVDCKTVISADAILKSSKVAGSVDEHQIECHRCYHTFNYKIQTARGDPRNIAYDG